MNAEQIEIARLWVAAPGWRWLDGMLTSEGVRIIRRDDDGYTIGFHAKAGYLLQVERTDLPDVTDPATEGAAVGLLRELYGDDRLCLVPMSEGRWGVKGTSVLRLPVSLVGPTRAAAIAAALEAAPVKP